jgi:L-fuconolactonase
MPVMDAHVHLLPPPMQYAGYRIMPPRVPGSDADLLAVLDAHDVARAVVVQTPWMGEDPAYLLTAARRHDGRLAVVGWLESPDAADAADRLAAQYEVGVRGLRLHLIDEGEVAAAAEDALSGVLAQAGRLDVPVLLLFRSPKVFPIVESLAAAHPYVRFVIDHLGHVDPDSAPDVGALVGLAAMDNVHVKLCLHYRLSRQSAPWSDLLTLQRHLLDAFGPDRLLWGSNFPLHLDDAPYGARLAAVRDRLGLASDEAEAVLHRTAARLWPAPAPAMTTPERTLV